MKFRKYSLWLAVLMIFSLVQSALALSWDNLKSGQESLYATAQTRPVKGANITDQVFGTSILRLSDARADGFNSVVPDYSKRQAWNLDGTLMMLRDADSNVLLFDGKTYKFIKKLDGVGGEDVFWSPTSAREIWFNTGNNLQKYSLDNDTTESIYEFSNYSFANTRAEGNLSRDGKSYAVVGQNYSDATGEVTFKDLVLLDIPSKTIVSKLALPAVLDGFDWVSVSPLGNYVVVDYANDSTDPFHGVEVYDRSFHLKWRKPIGAGHSDLGVDENGREFLLMDYYNSDTNQTEIKKFDLADGSEKVLLNLSPVFDLHESCRNIQRAGWCLVSTFDYVQKLTASSSDWLPFENEVFMLKLDGTQTVKRIAHHHSRRYSPNTPDSDTSNYFAEPHATISPDGNKVIFASNWEEDIAQSNSVDTFLVDLGSSTVVSPQTYIFSDVKVGDQGSEAIKYLKDNRIVGGYADGSFKPDQTINRVEFVKIVIGMLLKKTGAVGLDSDLSLSGISFSDVPGGEWYIPYLRRAVLLLLISGYPDGTFLPAKNISLVEAAKILVIAKGVQVSPDPIWYKPYLDVIEQSGARPASVTTLDQKITRREMAEMIYQLNK